MQAAHRKQIVFVGCGTGRSGTVSLSKLMSRCRDFHCTHEQPPLLHWRFSEKLYERKKKQLLADSSMDIGDVHSAYLPYLEQLIKDIPNVKIVCIQRPNDEVVRSFEKKIGPNKNHWYDHKGDGWEVDTAHDPTFPTYKIKNRRQAITKYVIDYDKEIKRLAYRHPDNILIVQIDELGSLFGQRKIFKFVGVKPMNRRYISRANTKYNQGRLVK